MTEAAMKACHLILCVSLLLPACDDKGSPAAPSDPARVTETFVLTTTLRPDGAMAYPVASEIPTIVVGRSGLVDARVTFSVVAGCEFVFALDPRNAGGNPVLSRRGTGPELSFQGTAAANTYTLPLVARSGGVSLCGPLPPEGVAMPHTIVVTHP